MLEVEHLPNHTLVEYGWFVKRLSEGDFKTGGFGPTLNRAVWSLSPSRPDNWKNGAALLVTDNL
jgi:hypothetical protein